MNQAFLLKYTELQRGWQAATAILSRVMNPNTLAAAIVKLCSGLEDPTNQAKRLVQYILQNFSLEEFGIHELKLSMIAILGCAATFEVIRGLLWKRRAVPMPVAQGCAPVQDDTELPVAQEDVSIQEENENSEEKPLELQDQKETNQDEQQEGEGHSQEEENAARKETCPNQAENMMVEEKAHEDHSGASEREVAKLDQQKTSREAVGVTTKSANHISIPKVECSTSEDQEVKDDEESDVEFIPLTHVSATSSNPKKRRIRVSENGVKKHAPQP